MGQMYKDYIDKSTVLDTAFGEAGGGANFSEASLLSVASRLPLQSTQIQCGMALANAVDLALLTMKERKITYKHDDIQFSYKDIPSDYERLYRPRARARGVGNEKRHPLRVA